MTTRRGFLAGLMALLVAPFARQERAIRFALPGFEHLVYYSDRRATGWTLIRTADGKSWDAQRKAWR